MARVKQSPSNGGQDFEHHKQRSLKRTDRAAATTAAAQQTAGSDRWRLTRGETLDISDPQPPSRPLTRSHTISQDLSSSIQPEEQINGGKREDEEDPSGAEADPADTEMDSVVL